MFCEKCGKRVTYDSLFCENCGAKVEAEDSFGNFGSLLSKRNSAVIGAVCVAAFFCVLIFSRGGSEQTDEDIDLETMPDTSVVQAETDNDATIVQSVKNGTNSAYPGVTYGEAFDSFFGSPKWRYFEGTNESTGETVDVVEFTGTCTSNGESGEALIQFVLYDDGTFSPEYFSFNDEPQTMINLNSLIEAVFDKAADSFASSQASTQENDTSEAYVLSDEEAVTDVMLSYCRGLCNAINYNNYAYVSDYIDSGSPLDESQKSLITRLYSKGITETFDNCIINYIEMYDDYCYIYVTESEYINYSDGSRERSEYDWKYTAVCSNGRWWLTNIE